MAGCQFEALITPKLSGQVTGTRVGAYVIKQQEGKIICFYHQAYVTGEDLFVPPTLHYF